MGPRWRRLSLGLQTVLGVAQKGYFIPYRHAAKSVAPTSYPAIESLFEQAAPKFAELLAEMDGLADQLNDLNGPPPRPRWTQDWFARLDGAAAYTMVASQKPKRIIEIGSGHSTRFMHAAVADAGLDIDMTSIDPQPRADIAALPITHHRTIVQNVDFELFGALEAGDFLFVDSSHILMPGSDVDLVLSEIFPRLPAGVFLHFHDILLPDAYPPQWAWRGYNEQQGIAPLLGARGVEIFFSSHFVATRMADRLASHAVAQLPLNDNVPETSLWLRKLASGTHEIASR